MHNSLARVVSALPGTHLTLIDELENGAHDVEVHSGQHDHRMLLPRHLLLVEKEAATSEQIQNSIQKLDERQNMIAELLVQDQ